MHNVGDGQSHLERIRARLLGTDSNVVLFRRFGPCSSISFDNVQSAIFRELKNLLPTRVTNRSCLEVFH